MNTLKVIGVAVAVVAVLVALQFFGWASYDFWGKKYEGTRREIFEQSKSYKHGTVRDLQNLVTTYHGASTDAHRDAIVQVIRHRIAAFDTQDLPAHVRKQLTDIGAL